MIGLVIRFANQVQNKNENVNLIGLNTNPLQSIFSLKRWNPMICKEQKIIRRRSANIPANFAVDLKSLWGG